MKIYTSESHPLRIDEIQLPDAGTIGMTLCPGKSGPSGDGNWWARDIEADKAAIESQGYTGILRLLEDKEYEQLDKERYLCFNNPFFEKHYLPLVNDKVPFSWYFNRRWKELRPKLYRALAPGKKLLVHCNGGLGRTGIVVARILVDFGFEPLEAIYKIRAARPGALEDRRQVDFVLKMKKL